MSLSEEQRMRASALLLQARARGERLSDWPADLPIETQEDAEAICECMALGMEHPIGAWKIGAMNPALPVKHGLVRPFCGQVPQALIYPSGCNVRWSELLRPVVEAEILLQLGDDLPPRSSPYTRTEVANCVSAVMPGIEIPESRLIDGHALGAFGMVADQGYAGRLVVGAACPDWRNRDLALETVDLRINDRVVATGRGARAMGHPLDALTWLANYRSQRGDGLRGGQLISTGSLTGIQMTRPGDQVHAQFDGLGEVALTMR